MSNNPRLDKIRAEKSFLRAQAKAGAAKDTNKKSKRLPPHTPEAVIQKALAEGTKDFFSRVLDDTREAMLWNHFLQGRVMERDDEGEPLVDRNGRIIWKEITGVSWNAFKQMVAYKRGMPALKVESDASQGNITVNFNVMGASHQKMEQQVRELGLLPESASTT